MPRNPRRKQPKPFDLAEAQRLYGELKSYRKAGSAPGTNCQAVYWALNAVPTNEDHGPPAPSLQWVEVVGEPVSADDNAHVLSHRHSTADPQARPDAPAAEVTGLKAHRLEVGAWIAALQGHSRDTTQPSAEVYGTDLCGIGQRGVDHEPTWADPDDVKSVTFHLLLPRGLKPLSDAEAKCTGVPASKPVQRLLMAALPRPEGER
jgi:hypothetical protein